MNFEEKQKIFNKIIQDDDETLLQVPLKDLIWAIVCYSDEMKEYEDGAMMGKGKIKYRDDLMISKEYSACRRDELARLISRYSDFDTQKIWKEVDKIFTKVFFITMEEK